MMIRQQSRHLLTEEEILSSTQLFVFLPGSVLSGGAVLKVWSKDINCFFFSVNAIGKKRRLYFFRFTHLLDCRCARRTNTTNWARLVCVMIAFFKHESEFRVIKVKKKKNFSVLFHLPFLVVYFLSSSTRAPKTERFTFRHEFEGEREKFLRL